MAHRRSVSDRGICPAASFKTPMSPYFADHNAESVVSIVQRGKLTSGTNTVRFSCCGVRIAVEFDSHIPTSNIRSVLPPEFREFQDEEADHHFSLVGAGRTPHGEQMYRIGEGSTIAASPVCFGQAMVALHKTIRHCVAEYAWDRVFIHAGVVAWKGRGIICPGPSFAGKSTLIRSMLNSGATYYSDEYAVFDSNGYAHPFPVPICLREADGRGQIIAADHVGTAPLNPSLVLFALYRKNGWWQPSTLTPGQTLLRLLQNSVSMRRNPHAVLKVLKEVTVATKGFAGERGEAEAIKDWLEGLAF
jgi:hypothetical protein